MPAILRTPKLVKWCNHTRFSVTAKIKIFYVDFFRFAHVEFEDEKCVEMALALDNTSFCGRNIQISKKPNELAYTSATTSAKRFFPSKRFATSRSFKRYARSASFSRSWTRTAVTRNKTWIKPGYTPS